MTNNHEVSSTGISRAGRGGGSIIFMYFTLYNDTRQDNARNFNKLLREDKIHYSRGKKKSQIGKRGE